MAINLQLKNHLENYYFQIIQHGIRENYDIYHNPNQKKYVYRNMYRNNVRCRTSIKNKFLLRGSINRQADGIPIGAFNVPKRFCCYCGRKNLVEGVDYSVNYQLGEYKF
jgi:cell surface protein SprA